MPCYVIGAFYMGIHVHYYHAAHYTGFSGTWRGVLKRLDEHNAGRGAKFTAAVVAAGCEWKLVAVYRGGRDRERQLKRQKNAPRLCDQCNPRLKRRREREIF